LGAALPTEFHGRRIFELTAQAPHRTFSSILKLWEKLLTLTLTLSRWERGQTGTAQ